MISRIMAGLSIDQIEFCYGSRVGPLATIGCKLRQARKGATVAADSCAGMWLTRFPPIMNNPHININNLT